MEVWFIALITFLATFFGTIAGFGLSTIMFPIMIIFTPLAQALLLVGILHWFNDIWKITLFRKGLNWSIIMPFGIAAVITSFLGALLVFSIPKEILLRLLGLLLSLYAFFILIKPAFKLKETNTNIISGGLVSGFIAGLSGIGGEVRGAFLSAFNLKKTVYIATAGTIALAIDTTRIATYFAQGARLLQDQIMGLLILVPLSLLGAIAARFAVNKIPQKHFRKVISIFLLVIGLKLVIFP